jgi:fructose-1,6-bisphosphatase II
MEVTHSHQSIERDIAIGLVRVTEAAAMAAARYLGRGCDKTLVDEAALVAIRYTLGYIQMDGIGVIGEGEKDHAPILYIGERIGDGSDLQVDIAFDAIMGLPLWPMFLDNGDLQRSSNNSEGCIN